MNVNDALIQQLQQSLDATHVDLTDNSWQHAGHTGNPNPQMALGTHLQLVVVSPRFEGVSLLNRHRMVHQALSEAFKTHLHALELKTLSPAEWETNTTASQTNA